MIAPKRQALDARVAAWTQTLPWVLRPWARLAWRFTRFGIVGGSGIAVNQLVLWLGMQLFFAPIPSEQTRLTYALPLAIGVATLYNFFGNRFWTWHDRKSTHHLQTTVQLLQYIAATLVGSSIQFYLTRALASEQAPLGFVLHYALANLLAIGVASIANFILNDRLTFRRVA